MWKIRLMLEGGLSHTLNDVRLGKPGWAECQPSKIEYLTFAFTGKDEITGKDSSYKIILSGMDEYNFFVEATRGVLGGKTTIKGLWFLGKILSTNRVVGFVLKDSILKVNTENGKEYSGFATVGWKSGVSGKIIAEIRR